MTSSVLVGFKPSYHGVVLAAGRNTRLTGVIPSYHKPLMVVNGRPLVVNIVRELSAFCSTITVIVSPENAGVITEVLEANSLLTGDVNIVLQPRARGPGEAVLRGMRAGQGENRTIIICADNIIPAEDYARALELDAEAGLNDPLHTVTVSTIATNDYDEARRFTRVYGNRFVEGVDSVGDDNGYYYCWVGPLIVPTEAAESVYVRAVNRYHQSACGAEGPKEVKVSGPLNDISNLTVIMADGHSVDIGTSDSLFQVIKESA